MTLKTELHISFAFIVIISDLSAFGSLVYRYLMQNSTATIMIKTSTNAITPKIISETKFSLFMFKNFPAVSSADSASVSFKNLRVMF